MPIYGDARVLGKPTYSFLRTIDEGNVAITKLFRHQVLEIDVVQKTISFSGLAGGIDNEPGLLETFDHPRVIRVREAQWDPDFDPSLKAITFTTNYYPGESVGAALIAGHAFSTHESFLITRCVLEALHYLHVDAGVIHRDVKPGNILLNLDRNEGFVGDLGSASYIDETTACVAASGGTLLYRPPEFASGQLDVRSDLYSTGLTLFEMLNGAFDYEALDASALEQRADEGKPALQPRHLTFRPWVNRPIRSFVKKLMNPDRAKRFSSADEALRALTNVEYVDWRKGNEGEWSGRWPPRQPAAKQRLVRVRSIPATGRHAGMSSLSAASSKDQGATWRSYASLARRVPTADLDALARFFRDVEESAQKVAVRKISSAS